MLGLGWTEMLVVGVVALIVIGPKELPELMRRLGRFTAQVRRMGGEFQRELNRSTGLDEVRNLQRELTRPLKDTSDAIRREFNSVSPSGKVEPSGVLKPAEPGAESVVKEIRDAAGMSAPAAAAAVSTPAKSAAPADGDTSGSSANKPASRKRAATGATSPSTATTKAAVSAKSPAKRRSKPAARAESKPAAEAGPASEAGPQARSTAKRTRKRAPAAASGADAAPPKPRATRAPRQKKSADE